MAESAVGVGDTLRGGEFAGVKKSYYGNINSCFERETYKPGSVVCFLFV